MEEIMLEYAEKEKFERPDFPKFNGRILRVYLDKLMNKKFITIYAAIGLGFISYETAQTSHIDYFFVTDEMIAKAIQMGCTIEYVLFRDKTDENDLDDYYFLTKTKNEFNDNKETLKHNQEELTTRQEFINFRDKEEIGYIEGILNEENEKMMGPLNEPKKK